MFTIACDTAIEYFPWVYYWPHMLGFAVAGMAVGLWLGRVTREKPV